MPEVTSATGVYHADGSVVGELRYVLGKLAGTARCALCDISHGGLRPKGDFRRCREGLPVPLTLVHLDERSDAVRAFTEGRTPCVVGHAASGLVMLLDAPALEACAGDVAAFERALRAAL